MLRVKDPAVSLKFYKDVRGMSSRVYERYKLISCGQVLGMELITSAGSVVQLISP